ncbi:uncharacterized protein LOC134281005 [Saccostrea cucullata]|uniref:uncharacterized protein LOC134281005 n=1 Tax=Saccostrea cuccullata TaxID=36930 RepID=UPI002ED68B71
MVVLSKRKEKINKERTKLTETIYPTYQGIASDVEKRLNLLQEEYENLLAAITKQEEIWHREITELVNKLKSRAEEMKKEQLKTLQKHFDEIKQKNSDIKDDINSTNDTLNSTNISEVFSFLSQVDRYRTLPKKIVFGVPEFSPNKIQEDQLYTFMPGVLKEDEYKFNMTKSESPDAASSPPVKQLIDEPETVTTIKIDLSDNTRTNPGHHSVVCLNNEKIWTSGGDSTMRLYSINQGSLLKSITTKPWKRPRDISLTKSGDLVYCDGNVNIVKNEKIEEVIRLKKWRLSGVCITYQGDLLVTMHDNNKQSKVVRYSGSTEKQTIQFDEMGTPLFLFGDYICENRNLDICVSDSGAKAGVVVNQAGKLRFRYSGHTPAPKNKPFRPQGITTDSQSHILTNDCNNDCVHIIDQDGQFLRYIDCGLSEPWGLCTDTNDNLFVVQERNRQVKKIKYLK